MDDYGYIPDPVYEGDTEVVEGEIVEVELLQAQETFIFDDALYPAVIGGLGSGKSEAGVARAIRLKLDTPNQNTGYYLPTYDLINLMAIPRFEETLTRMGLVFRTNKSEYAIYIEGYSAIILRSMQNPERIIAYETGDAVIDELDTLKLEDASLIWRKISERTRAKKDNGFPNTLAVVTTPDMGDTGFCYSRWGGDLSNDNIAYVDGEPYIKYSLTNASTYDNIYLPEGYVDQIKQNYDPVLADLYLRGQFVSLNQDKVYYCYDKLKHDTSRVIEKGDILLIGLDFNIGACCYCVYVRDMILDTSSVYYGRYVYHMVDEGYGHDTRALVNIFHDKYSAHDVVLFPDSTGKKETTNASSSDIAILREDFEVNAPPGNGAVRERVASTNGLFAHNRLFINSKKCPKSAKAFKAQGWDKNGKPEKYADHQGGAIDDYTDGGTYPLVRLEGLSKPKIGSHNVKTN